MIGDTVDSEDLRTEGSGTSQSYTITGLVPTQARHRLGPTFCASGAPTPCPPASTHQIPHTQLDPSVRWLATSPSLIRPWHLPYPASQTYKYSIVAVSSESSFSGGARYTGSTYSALQTHMGTWSSGSWSSNNIDESYWPTATVQQQPSCEPDAGHGLVAVGSSLTATAIGLRWRAVVDNGMPITKYQVRARTAPEPHSPRSGPVPRSVRTPVLLSAQRHHPLPPLHANGPCPCSGPLPCAPPPSVAPHHGR